VHLEGWQGMGSRCYWIEI